MNCQHCFSDIQTKVCYCPECGFSYHEECWRKNNSKCVQYGCKGKTGVLENPDDKKEENEVKDEVINRQTNNLNEVTFRAVDKSKNNQQNIIYALIGVIFLLVISMFYFNNSNKTIPIESAKKIEANVPINESIKKIESIKSENNLKIEVTSTPYKEQESTKPIEKNIDKTIYPSKSNNTKTENNISETEKQELEKLIVDWRKMKIESFKNIDSSNFSNLLTGKVLDDTIGAINWLKNNNGYRDIEARGLDFLSMKKNSNGNYIVKVKISEINKYYQNGEYRAKNSSDNSYKAIYSVKYDGNILKIFDSEVEN